LQHPPPNHPKHSTAGTQHVQGVKGKAKAMLIAELILRGHMFWPNNILI
jgi:hypothetical protein